MIPYIFLILAISGVIAGAGILSLGKFGDTLTTKCINSSFTYSAGIDACVNNTAGVVSAGEENRNLSEVYYGISKSKDGMGEVTQQFPTIGIIAVMVIIISLIAGVFVYMAYFR